MGREARLGVRRHGGGTDVEQMVVESLEGMPGERGMKREGTGDDRLAPREGFFPGGAELVGSVRARDRWPLPTMSVIHSGPGRRQKCTYSSSA